MKIKLTAKLINDDGNLQVNVIGIKNKNKIIYKEKNITVILYLMGEKIKMTRSCNDYEINLTFDKLHNTISTYSVFGSKKIFELETITKKLIITDTNIEIEYVLEGNSYYYHLQIGG